MYESEITSRNRTAFVILVDRSQSMSETIATDCGSATKAAAVSVVVSRIISELIARARRDNGVRDYYDIAVLGYFDERVVPLIDPRRVFIPVSEFGAYAPERCSVPRRVVLPDGSVSMRSESVDMWIKPQACGDTPMYGALLYVRDIVAEWCAKPHNAASFPPVVFHITDGEASDCDPDELKHLCRQIKSLATADGNVLLINIHITADPDARPVIFPVEEEIDGDRRYVRLLADCSSIMPEPFAAMIRRHRDTTSSGPFYAMSYNASITELITMLDIGSRSVTDIL